MSGSEDGARCAIRPSRATAESYEITLMPRCIARLSVGTTASGSFAEIAIASTRCAISEFSTSIWPSAVGVVGPVKITSASSSFAASSAPLCTASKKPLPRDFATRPTRVFAGPSGFGSFLPQAAKLESRTVPMTASSVLLITLPLEFSGEFLDFVFFRDLGDDHLDARRLEVLELLRPRPFVGHDRIDSIEAGHDHRGPAAQLGAVRHHDDVLRALQ